MSPDAAFKFCTTCGQRIAFSAPACPHCGQPFARQPHDPDASTSPRSYGVAVALCGVFGVMGIHHFYIGNHLHGLIDLALFIAFVVCYAATLPGLALVFLLIDVVHTIFVFTRLIIGKQMDGYGRVIRPPFVT